MSGEKIFRDLAVIFGSGRVSRTNEELQKASRDLCPGNLAERHRPPFASFVAKPNGPRYVEQIQELVSLALSYEPKLRIIPRGGGSGVCGALNAEGGEVILDCTALNDTRILAYPTLERDGMLWAQAGAFGEHIDRALQRDGRRLTCGHYPASYYVSTLGGWVQCGASGQYSARFGTIQNLLRSVRGLTGAGDFVTFEGEELSRVIGMEGTSLLLLEGELPIFQIPRYDGYASFSFDDIEDTGSFLKDVYGAREVFNQAGAELYAVRCYDFLDYHVIAKPHKGDSYKPDWYKAAEYFVERRLCKRGRFAKHILGVGESLKRLPWTGLAYYAADAEEHLEGARTLLEATVLKHGGRMADPTIGQMWHRNRFKLGYDKLVARFRSGSGIMGDTFDCAPSWDTLPDTYEEVREAISEFGIGGAHCGIDLDGPYIYFTFALPGRSNSLYREAWESILYACIASGARTNHHHGIGKLKAGPFNSLAPFANGSDWYARARLVKREMDPHRILNPQNLV